jgi:membrane protein DedA with SNARE-associated domain
MSYLSEVIAAAGSNPLLLCLVLILVSFVLEDLAVVMGAGLVMHGSLTPALAFAAVAGGIIIGDLGLYGAGRLARRSGRIRRWLEGHGPGRVGEQLRHNLLGAMLLARIIPGLRTVTFAGAGLFRARFDLFTLIVLLCVIPWTAALMFAGSQIVTFFAMVLGISPLSATLLLASIVMIATWALGRHKA